MTREPPGSSPAPGLAPALDVEAGVERLMGNRQVYLRVLDRFGKDYRQAGAMLRAALDAGDPALAQRLAHTLKGAAGMIGAGALQAAALAVEQALRSGERHPDELLLQADAALSAVLREVDGMAFPVEEAARPAPPAVPGARKGLRAMLDIGDGAALELVTAARAELEGELGEREYDRLCAAVMAFDYERALELLDRPDVAGR